MTFKPMLDPVEWFYEPVLQSPTKRSSPIAVIGFQPGWLKCLKLSLSCISYLGVSKNRGTPKWMVYNGKPYFLMDDLGVPLFSETPIYLQFQAFSPFPMGMMISHEPTQAELADAPWRGPMSNQSDFFNFNLTEDEFKDWKESREKRFFFCRIFFYPPQKKEATNYFSYDMFDMRFIFFPTKIMRWRSKITLGCRHSFLWCFEILPRQETVRRSIRLRFEVP